MGMYDDITDNEIRIIGSKSTNNPGNSKPDCPARPDQDLKLQERVKTIHGVSSDSGIKIKGCLLLIGAIVAALIGIYLLTNHAASPNVDKLESRDINSSSIRTAEPDAVPEGEFESLETKTNQSIHSTPPVQQIEVGSQPGCYTEKTTINDIPIKILLPSGAKASLHIGKINSKNTDIILALQAADIRKDNGKIVGAAVQNGKVISEGLAKKGFVAIINGEITVGVTDHSPYFEEAIQNNGDFFRQYPLVSQRQIVENNPKNLSIRRGLCQQKNRIFIVETEIPVSFHDFSQLLVDLQVDNAVYLVGSQYACGFLRDKDGQLETWGQEKYSRHKNISYIVWKK